MRKLDMSFSEFVEIQLNEGFEYPESKTKSIIKDLELGTKYDVVILVEKDDSNPKYLTIETNLLSFDGKLLNSNSLTATNKVDSEIQRIKNNNKKSRINVVYVDYKDLVINRLKK